MKWLENIVNIEFNNQLSWATPKRGVKSIGQFNSCFHLSYSVIDNSCYLRLFIRLISDLSNPVIIRDTDKMLNMRYLESGIRNSSFPHHKRKLINCVVKGKIYKKNLPLQWKRLNFLNFFIKVLKLTLAN